MSKTRKTRILCLYFAYLIKRYKYLLICQFNLAPYKYIWGLGLFNILTWLGLLFSLSSHGHARISILSTSIPFRVHQQKVLEGGVGSDTVSSRCSGGALISIWEGPDAARIARPRRRAADERSDGTQANRRKPSSALSAGGPLFPRSLWQRCHAARRLEKKCIAN
jgi:hypothetical protein